MPMKWDQAADAQLLTAILKCHNFKLDYLAIAKDMGHDLTEIAVKRRIERIKAMVGSKEGAGTDATSSSPHSTPMKKANGVNNGFNPINKSKSGTSGANKNVDGNGIASDANDADDDCTPSATGNDTENATANEGENLSGATKAGAAKPSGAGKDSTQGGKGSRGGSRAGRAGGSAGSKRKASATAATDPETGKPLPKTTKSKVGPNGKVKKSVKAAGPIPVGPLPNHFDFFDPPPDIVFEDDNKDAGTAGANGKKKESEVTEKKEVDKEKSKDSGEYAADEKAGNGGNDGNEENDDDDNNDDDDDDGDDLQDESPGRKKLKLEDVTKATAAILNDVAADMMESEKTVGVATTV